MTVPPPSFSPEEYREQWRLVCTLDMYGRARMAASDLLTTRSQERLVTDPRVSVREALARNPRLLPEVELRLASDPSHYVRRYLARNASVSPEAARVLVEDDNSYVLRHLAGNPSLPGDVALHLASSCDVFEVRSRLAANRSASPEALALLAGDGRLQRAVGHNTSAPLDVLLRLPVARVPSDRLVDLYGSDPRWESIRVLSEGWTRTLGDLLVACEELHPLR